MPPTPQEFRKMLQQKVQGKNEKKAREAVEQALSSAQFRGSYTKATGRIDNGTANLYIWKGSPGGDLVLAVGASVRPRILELGELVEDAPSRYSLASPPTGSPAISTAAGASPPAAIPVAVAVAPRPTATDAVVAAETAAKNAGLAPAPVPISPPEDLDTLKRRLAGVVDAYSAGLKAVESREYAALEMEEAAKAEAQRLQERARTLDAESARVVADKQAAVTASKAAAAEMVRVQAAKAEHAAERARSIAREEAVQAREADADAGFLRRREDVLAELDASHEELLEKNAQLARDLEDARQKHAVDLLAREAAHRGRLELAERVAGERQQRREGELEEGWRKRAEGLDGRDVELRAREAKLTKAIQQARWAQEEADGLRDHVKEHIEERARALMADVEADLTEERSRSTALRARLGALEQQLEERRDAERALSHESPEEVHRRIQLMQSRLSALETELLNRPSLAEAAELSDLRDAQIRWQDERRTLLKDLSIARRQLDTRNIDVDEVEILRDRNAALKENQRLLQAALDDLRTDIDDRLDKSRDQPVFPELLRMDDDAVLRVPTAQFYSPDAAFNLVEFTNYLRNRMGKAAAKGQPDLYYRMEEIRAFLGGLAMSRLHLLQGISGIGKSSLPRRFAEAVGGRCETISVQAGWRDRNDLLGYFNAFDKRYNESAFVQALYLAQTPQYRDRIVLVLLDEMNLSHPEQYGADVLDVLARDVRAERRFELMSARAPGKVPLGLQDGRYLPLPENVWFVGTANHDETTKDFADKTYDRSFVLALPGSPKVEKLAAERRRPPLALEMLMASFDEAERTYAADADRALHWMDEHLRGPMVEHFGVGWGGRLESHAKRFVPVVRAADGKLGEALDQLVATRVIRRIQGKHDLLEEDLRGVLRVVESSWPDKQSGPVETTRMLRRELKRMGAEA